MIRVLQIMGTLDCGGAENMIMNLYRNIDREKIQFDFIVHKKEKCFFEDEVEKLGGHIYRLPHYNLINHFLYKHKLKSFFKEHPEYKIAHLHIRSIASIIIGVAKKFNIITISHSHSTSNGKGIKSFIKEIFQKNIRKKADFLFACSKESAEWLFGDKCKNDNCYIINNAIDTSKYKYNLETRKKIRKQLNLKEELAIVQIGRFNDMKNHKFSIELFKEYIKTNKNSKLFFVGDGEMRQDLEDKVKKEHLEDRIIFLGLRSDIADLLQGMDVFIMPSIFEGLPLSLVEAQAASIPSIISKNITAGILNEKIVKQLKLEDNYQEWIKEINKVDKNDRKDDSEIVLKSGYDIRENAEWLEKFYVKLMKKKKKILYYVPAFSYGGIETLFENIYDNINHNEFNIDLVAEREIPFEIKEKLIKNGDDFYNIGRKIIPKIKNINNIINNNYDLIHSHSISSRFILVLMFKFLTKSKIIVHSHSNGFNTRIKAPIYRISTIINIMCSDKLCSCSEESAKFYFGKINVKKTKIIKNGIDFEKYIKTQKKQELEEISKNRKVIGFIGRLSYIKNPFFLIKLAEELLLTTKSFIFVVIGSGELEDELKKKVEDKNLVNYFKFCGFKKNVNDYLQYMDCVVMPSFKEGIPLLAIEVQSFGKTLLCSNNVNNEIKVNNNVFFINLNDMQEWKNQIINNREIMQPLSKEILNSPYNIKNTVRDLEIYYEKVIKNEI